MSSESSETTAGLSNTSGVSYRGRDIPWLDAVRFHKEIVSRAEEGFFSLNARDDQDTRWSSLTNFEPNDLRGPWFVPGDGLVSRQFELALEQGEFETLFLGGPGVVGWSSRSRGRPVPQWRPLLYREIELRETDGGWYAVPRQGEWSLSPLLWKLLERLEVVADDPEAFTARVLERTAAFHSTMDDSLDISVRRALLTELPDLEEEFERSLPGDLRVLPSPWILFAPTTHFSALVRYLMADYERLEAALQSDASIGGLVAFEDRPFPKAAASENEVLPVVPLNEEQRVAVQTILSGQPLTVISGPPGTGKSQVVVSLLLNAWAKGKTVLFASNNNKAVDVVRERLERFESEFPIAVRAGAQRFQNVQEVLRRVQNMASVARTESNAWNNAETLAERRESLLEQKEEYEKALQTNLPQRIDQSLRTALRGYGNYRMMLQRIREHEVTLLDQQKELGYGDLSPEELRLALSATMEWTDGAARHQRLEVQAQKKIAALHKRMNELEDERNELLEFVGVNSSEVKHWAWLSQPSPITQMTHWVEQLQVAISEDTERDLKPFDWDEQFERWRSKEHAREWAGKARDFARRLEASYAEARPLIDRRSNLKDALKEYDVHILHIDPTTLDRQATDVLYVWLTAYTELATTLPTLASRMPWSPRARAERQLHLSEKQLRNILPVEFWLAFGPINPVSRQRLAQMLSSIRRWLGVKAELVMVEEKIANLAKHVASPGLSGLEEFVKASGPEDWAHAADQIREMAKFAERAAIAWQTRMRHERAKELLRSTCSRWTQLAKGFPVWEAWRDRKGSEMDAALGEAAANPSADSLISVRRAFYSGSLLELVDAWSKAHSSETSRLEVQQEIEQVSRRSHFISGWWSERPESALLFPRPPEDWPTSSEIQDQLKHVIEWVSEWDSFRNGTMPSLRQKADEELMWAVEQLEQLTSLVSSGTEGREFAELVHKVTADPDRDWPISELTRLTASLGSEQIQASIARVEAELERLSFEEAKSRWLKRLVSDDDTLRSMYAVERAYAQNRGRVPERFYDDFQRALKAVPIWITTAQAPQAIPLQPGLFDLVVIDEASQCTLTNVLPLIFRGTHLAVIGDDRQLPAIPTLQSAEELVLARKHGVEESLPLLGHAQNDVYNAAVESLPRRRSDIIHLREHFRSHPQIIGFSNRYVYMRTLQLKKDPEGAKRLPIPAGVHMRAVQGVALRGPDGRSWMNPPEADEVLSAVADIRGSGHRSLSLGIVTPFRAQKELLRERLHSMGLGTDILVDTAYGFQGDERDIIIFSPVVANGITPSAAGWVEQPPNLINVATTRSREALIVVADFDFCLAQEGILRELALYCKDIQRLRETSAAELELFSWMVVHGWEPVVHPVIVDVEVDFELTGPDGTRLVVEVDGSQHELTQERDAAVDVHLQATGRKVLRVTAREVLETPFDVLHRIERALGSRDGS